MKKYKGPIIDVFDTEFESILETSITDIDGGILDFDVDPDEIV